MRKEAGGPPKYHSNRDGNEPATGDSVTLNCEKVKLLRSSGQPQPPPISEAPLEFALIVLTVTLVSARRRTRRVQAPKARGCEAARC